MDIAWSRVAHRADGDLAGARYGTWYGSCDDGFDAWDQDGKDGEYVARGTVVAPEELWLTPRDTWRS